MARQAFVQTIYSWKSAQVRRQNLQASGYQWIHLLSYSLHWSTKSDVRSWACSKSGDVLYVLYDLQGCYRTVVADNFFIGIPLANFLLAYDTYLIGTLRSNRVGSGSEVAEKNLRRGEVYGLQNKGGVKLITWKDKKNFLMISTRPLDSATVVDTGKINSKNERIMKPQVVLDYNEGSIGTDLSDQLSSYYPCLRRTIKWYRMVAFDVLFETALVNSCFICEDDGTAIKVTILHSRISLVRSYYLVCRSRS